MAGVMSDLGVDERNRVRDAFRSYLGREAGDDASIDQDHLRGDVYRAGGINAVVDAIRNSEEARRSGIEDRWKAPNPGAGTWQNEYRVSGDPQAPMFAGMPPDAVRTGTDTATAGPGGQTLYGTTPFTDRGSGTGAEGWDYGGYDFGQDANNRLIGKSAKYTMAEAQRIAKAMGASDTWRTKEGAADFAKQHLQKYLEDNGFEVLEIVGDKIKMRDHADRAAGREGSWVDWVEGAGGGNARLAWQVEGSQEAFGAPETYRPQGFTPTAARPPQATTQPVGAPQPLGPDPWGRPPGDPLYGQPPPYQPTAMSDLAYQELV